MSQTVKLIGVVDDGAALDPMLPRNTATTITIPRNGDVVVELDVFLNSGVPVTLGSGLFATWTAIFTAARNLDDCQRVFEIQVAGLKDSTQPNRIIFRLPGTRTRDLPLGRYLFDIWLNTTAPENKRWQVVKVSALILQPGLVRAT